MLRVRVKTGDSPCATTAAGTNEEPEQAEIADESGPVPTGTEYLPDTSPEEQYRSLARALQRMTFRQLKMPLWNLLCSSEHERAVDALFWQGRVSLFKASTKKRHDFSKFNSLYSSDPRIADTTLWIAESVASLPIQNKLVPFMTISIR